MIVLISGQITSRLLRLKLLYEKATGKSTFYCLMNKEYQLDLSGIDTVVLVAPFSNSVKQSIFEQAGERRLIVDLDPQYSFPPIVSHKVHTVTAPTQKALNYVTGKGNVVRGIINCFKTKEKREANLIVDFNNIDPSDLAIVEKQFLINGIVMANSVSLSPFVNRRFNRAIVGQELEDIEQFSDCNYGLFTKVDNQELAIPDTMIDCLIMNIPVIVTNELEAAREFIVEHDCGIIIDRTMLPMLKEILQASKPRNLFDTLDISDDIIAIKEVMK